MSGPDTELQQNPWTKTSLANCRAVFKRYRRGREMLDPIEEYNEDFKSPRHILINVVSGTLRIL